MSRSSTNLLDLELFARDEQHVLFRRLRVTEPISWHGHPRGRGFWNVVRHADIMAVSRDPRTYSSEVGGTSLLDPDELGGNQDPRGAMLLYMDPPKHTRYRQLVNRGFSTRVISRLERYLRERMAFILDQIIEDGACDFARDIATELPVQALARLMGVPYEDRMLLASWGDRISLAAAQSAATDDAVVAAAELYTYFSGVVGSRPSGRADDLVSVLTNSEVAGEKLSEFEFNMFMLLLTIAGQETTRHSMSLGMLGLLANPDQLAALRNDPGLVPGAVEEMLRWASPVQHFRRTATVGAEIGGRAVAAGDKVVLWYVSANRDESVFTAADSFDITRSPNDHLAFGGNGPHYCLGANLARLELHVLLDEVLARMPDITLLDRPTFLASNFIRGVLRFPVRFTPGVRRSQPSPAVT